MKTKFFWILPAAMTVFASCKDTWLMYDTDQTDHIYFKENVQTHIYSFSLLSAQTIEVSTTVYLMGQPSDKDRTCAVGYVDAPAGDSLRIGTQRYPVVSARPGVDFAADDLVIPAGKTSGTLRLTLHRTPEMKDAVNHSYVRVGIRLQENEHFLPLPADSSKASAVLSPFYYVYVNDGDPACPSWWRKNKTATPGYNQFWGNFFPGKFRKALELFHACETANPAFYKDCVARYGENLDAEPSEENSQMYSFWVQRNSTAWAKYVLIPLYNYYLDYYAAHPDDPHVEPMGSATGWLDATTLLY